MSDTDKETAVSLSLRNRRRRGYKRPALSENVGNRQHFCARSLASAVVWLRPIIGYRLVKRSLSFPTCVAPQAETTANFRMVVVNERSIATQPRSNGIKFEIGAI